MPLNEYHFVTHWRFQSTRQEIADILGDPLDLPRWWPSVYLAVDKLAEPDANGQGAVYALYQDLVLVET